VFERRLFSFDIGKTKNDPACFPAVLSLLDRTGGECVFVDDTPVNVENARSAGIHGIVFKGREALETEFSTLGIEVGA
jgi:2-haloacid dehalogenase